MFQKQGSTSAVSALSRTVGWLLLLVGMLLAGCNSKPPGCTDPEAVTQIKRILMEQVGEFNSHNRPPDADSLLATYWNALRMEITQVVSEGYQDDVQTQYCRGKMTVHTESGGKAETSVGYSIQQTVDGKESIFKVENKPLTAIAFQVASDSKLAYQELRFSGIWKGAYACGGYEDAKTGPQGPYVLPVEMVVDKLEMRLERTTRGGGVEVLTGLMHEPFQPGGIVLSGEGRNSPDDTWMSRFTGSIEGNRFKATGLLSTRYSVPIRSCRLELVRQAPASKPNGNPPSTNK